MAWTWDDRWLWLGLAAILVVSSHGISHAVLETSRLAALKDPNIAQITPDRDVEDAISLDALHTLSKSVNPDIANAATSLLISRFALSDADCDALTLELFSTFPQTRQRARQVLELIDTQSLTADFYKPDVLRVERVQELRNVSKGNIRTQSMCMAFFKSFGPLSQGIGSLVGVAEAVEAAWRSSASLSSPSFRSGMRTIVVDELSAVADHPERRLWAAAPWNGEAGQEVPAQRLEGMVHEVGLPSDWDAGVEHRLEQLRSNSRSETNPESLAQLLSRSDGAALPPGRNFTGDSLAQALSRRDGVMLPLGRNVDGSRRARFHEESPEETEVRRRRREAMVFHEGSGALGREDIIHPRTRMP